jgi:predicted metal-dependent HD superfamily phosphohydrolase/DNA-binding transcriptional regulator YbjK
MARPPNTSVRRQQIVHAFIRLLARQGHASASMAELAQECGLSQGLLHYHFTDRSQILAAVLAELERRLLDRVRLLTAGARSPDEELDAWVQVLLSPQQGDAEAMAAWVALGSAAARELELRTLSLGVLERLRQALLILCLDRPPGSAEALLALAEGSWRLGSLAPGLLPEGGPLAAARALLGLIPSTEDPAARRLRAIRELAPLELPEATWTELLQAWTSPGRHYHTLEHLLTLSLAWLEVAEEGRWSEATQVWLALLFHDAVYVPGAPDNEERSALLLLKHRPEAQRAAELVRLTAAHGRLDARSLDEDARLFLDCDTAILGAPAAEYRRYAEQVASEWAPVVDADGWRQGRAAFVEGLLAQKRVFLSDRFHDLLEAQARWNLAAELAGATS